MLIVWANLLDLHSDTLWWWDNTNDCGESPTEKANIDSDCNDIVAINIKPKQKHRIDDGNVLEGIILFVSCTFWPHILYTLSRRQYLCTNWSIVTTVETWMLYAMICLTSFVSVGLATSHMHALYQTPLRGLRILNWRHLPIFKGPRGVDGSPLHFGLRWSGCYVD